MLSKFTFYVKIYTFINNYYNKTLTVHLFLYIILFPLLLYLNLTHNIIKYNVFMFYSLSLAKMYLFSYIYILKYYILSKLSLY